LPEIHAHRGGTVVKGKPLFAEESIRAYRHAARDGFVLELDAKLTEDGVPVALHDATLDRTTNCGGELRTFTIAELLSFARGSGAEVNLEIKNVPTDPDFDSTPGYANRVMDVVLASRIPRSQLLIQSFIAGNLDPRTAAHARRRDEPAVRPGDQRPVPRDRGRQRLRPHIARVAGDGGLRAPGARPRARRGALHARPGRRRAER
jgi:glycerophosphoryl diester phosphodiesterase